MKYVLTLVLVCMLMLSGCDLGLFGPDIPDYTPTEAEIEDAFEAIGLAYLAGLFVIGLDMADDDLDNGDDDFDFDMDDLEGFSVDYTYEDSVLEATMTYDDFEVTTYTHEITVILNGTMYTLWNGDTEEGTYSFQVYCDSVSFSGTLYFDVEFSEDETGTHIEKFEVNGEDFSHLADDLL